MRAKDFDSQFDEGVDIIQALDLTKAKRVLQEQMRVNVDFPTWMIESLDREADRLGVARQSIINSRLAERLEQSLQLTILNSGRKSEAKNPSFKTEFYPSACPPQTPVAKKAEPGIGEGSGLLYSKKKCPVQTKA
jgi:hypothetical protein